MTASDMFVFFWHRHFVLKKNTNYGHTFKSLFSDNNRPANQLGIYQPIKNMASDPRAPPALRHPEDTPTTFEEVVRILKGPNKPFLAIPVMLCTDGEHHRLVCDAYEYHIEPDKIYFEDFEVHSHDLLYINWFRNMLSFILIVYRASSSETHGALSDA
jgi:hypothetical protein